MSPGCPFIVIVISTRDQDQGCLVICCLGRVWHFLLLQAKNMKKQV